MSATTKVWIEIEECRQAKAVESLLNSFFRNYGLERGSDLAHCEFAIYYGRAIPQDLSINAVYCPITSAEWLPKILAIEPKTGIPAPLDARWEWNGSCLILNFDLFSFLAGTVFRAEEWQSKFYEASFKSNGQDFLASRFGFANIPFVDLWFKWLFQQLLNREPVSIWQKNGSAVWLTHDVDQLLRWTWKRSLWHLSSAPFRFFWQAKKVWSESKEWWRSIWHAQDPLDSINYLLDLEGERKSTFFVMGWPRDHLTKRYDIRRNRFRKILQVIPQSNREIGLHGSPLHPSQANLLGTEKIRVSQALQAELNVFRSHYLRWDIRKTPQALIEIGIKVDSTLGYNDIIGYRCGTAMPFRWFDLSLNREINLTIAPLVIADHQMFQEMNEDRPNFDKNFQKSFDKCRNGGGVWTILLHDLYFSSLLYPMQKDFYIKLLDELDQQGVRYIQSSDLAQIHSF